MKKILLGLALGLSVPSVAQDDTNPFLIEGEVQKPEVTIVIGRDNLEKGFDLRLKESFLHKIPEALKLPIF